MLRRRALLRWDLAPTDHFQAMCGCGNHSGLNQTGARSLWSNILYFQGVTSFQHPGLSRAAAMVDLRRLEAIHALSYWPSRSGGTAKRPNRGRRLNLTTSSKLGRHWKYPPTTPSVFFMQSRI
jgi:hypothetical protein